MPLLKRKKDPDDENWEKLFLELTGGIRKERKGSRVDLGDIELNIRNSTNNLGQANDTTNTIPIPTSKTSISSTTNPVISNEAAIPSSPDTTDSKVLSALSRNPSIRRIKNNSLMVSNASEVSLMSMGERYIRIEALEEYILGKNSVDLEIEYGIPRSHLCRAVSQLKKADTNQDGLIEQSEWLEFYHNNFKDSKNLMPAFQFLLYQPTYNCSPPAIVILVISLLQLCFFIYHKTMISNLVVDDAFSGQAPTCSLLIYNPNKRFEVWRFLTYQFVHVNMEHIVFNTLMQLMVGIPLEMSQPGTLGTFKVVFVYLAGVVLGSVGGSLHNPYSYLAGASAGVYALIAAHLSTLILNWKEDGDVFTGRKKENKAVSQSLNPLIRWFRLIFVVMFTLFDLSYALYNYYSNIKTNTGYMGHLMGALAGLLVGIVMLENRKVEKWEDKLKCLCIITYVVLLLATVLWHLIGTDTDYFPPNDFNSNCQYTLPIQFEKSPDVDHTHL